MRIRFYKMHGAGNDFVLVDDRSLTFPAADREWLAATAARRTGVGCEGVILVQPSEAADFRMRFFNPDGREAALCGNGARCVARLARDLGVAPERMTIETAAGTLRAEMAGDQVRVHLCEPSDWRLNLELECDGRSVRVHFVNTGVPHAAVMVADVSAVPVETLGPAIRRHPAFQPEGANASFVAVAGENSLRVRTYERGVEAETLACGTGMVAAALLAARLGLVRPPVAVTPASGDLLRVEFDPTDAGARDVSLLGPVAYVYEGTIEYRGPAP